MENLSKNFLAKILKIPVFVENDANCFALIEAVFGEAQVAELVLGIITLWEQVWGAVWFIKKK